MTTEYLGIDVAKEKVDVALIQGEKTYFKVFPNQQKGFNALLKWLQQKQVQELHACMEATGSYWEKLAKCLFSSDYKVSVVNPFQIHHFAKCELSRTKTDKVDAGVIARYCKSQNPYPWKPLPPHKRELRDLNRRRDALKLMRSQELTRLKDPEISEIEIESINKIIQALTVEIKFLTTKIKEKIKQKTELNEEVRLLESIPGIGETTAVVILSEAGEISNFRSARQLAAYAGLTTRHKKSGKSVKGKSKLSKQGNSRLRKALYFPAVVAKDDNPIIKRFYQHLLAKGKIKKVALIAAMRKLLHIAYGVLKHKEPFNENYLPKGG